MNVIKIFKILQKKYSAYYKATFHYKEKDFLSVEHFSKNERKLVDAFWAPYISRFNYKFLEYYTSITNEFSVNYIPDDVWYNFICPYYNDSLFAKKVDDKALYDLYIRNFRMPTSVLRIIDGRLLDVDFNTVSQDEARSILNNFSGKGLIVKPAVESSGGHGIKKMAPCDYDYFIDNLQEYPNAIVQEIVQQSAYMEKMNPGCLNTIRISSLIHDNGKVSFPAAMFRMGVRGSIVDNVCSGGVFVGVNINSGCLKKYGYRRVKGKYVSCETHPETGIRFEGYYLEGFEKVKKLIWENAKYLPKTRLIGWDFAIGFDNQPILIEINLEDHELECLQIANGPYFGEQTENILKEVFKNKGSIL